MGLSVRTQQLQNLNQHGPNYKDTYPPPQSPQAQLRGPNCPQGPNLLPMFTSVTLLWSPGVTPYREPSPEPWLESTRSQDCAVRGCPSSTGAGGGHLAFSTPRERRLCGACRRGSQEQTANQQLSHRVLVPLSWTPPTIQGDLGWSQMTDPSGQQWGRGRGGCQGLTARF